ncbi:MAG TPA: anti-sigma regulatory factor [Methylomirabilota bacterium]|jgi:serine/threonine-protein kinase RsbT
MPLLRSDKLPLSSDGDVVTVRQRVRATAVESGFSLVDQTKIVTAASELARNTVVHGGGGTVEIAVLVEGARRGIQLTFRDHGPGIPDIAMAMRDGFTTGGGLGLGLGGARRLCNDFDIRSTPGDGTVVRITRWR